MENNNSCCFVAKINEVKAIEGADNIELVIAGGWNAITKKGEFKVGDETIIATTDAVIPETLEETAEIFVNNRFTKQICNDEYYPDIYASKSSIVESHILFAKWQQENSYSEKDMDNAYDKGFKDAMIKYRE